MKAVTLVMLVLALLVAALSSVSAKPPIEYFYAPVGSWEYNTNRMAEIGGCGSIVVNGNIVLTDSSCNDLSDTRCVRVLTPKGKLIRKWGSFKSPIGIVRDTTGCYYVLDRTTCKIYKYSPDYKAIKSWGGEGGGDCQFKFPTAIAIGPDNTIYVSDKVLCRITKFSTDGKFLGKFGEDVLNLPLSLVVDKLGVVWVGDILLLHKFKDDLLVKTYDLKIEGWDSIMSMAMGPDNHLYLGILASPPVIVAVDSYINLVSMSISAAQAPKAKGSKKQLYGAAPAAFCFAGNNMFVVDPNGFRVMVLKKTKAK